jgi:restriction system protein
VGLGFGDELGDLAKLQPIPEAFRSRWQAKRPQSSEAQTRVFYSMFYRFVHRVKIGDLVVYAPTWRERKLYVGRITGAYQYDRGRIFSFYAHRRSVEWVSEFSRDSFSPEALKGITVTLAIFQVQNKMFLDELNKKLR